MFTPFQEVFPVALISNVTVTYFIYLRKEYTNVDCHLALRERIVNRITWF